MMFGRDMNESEITKHLSKVGATVTVSSADGAERTITIVGLDEVDTSRGRVSWISPIAKALIKAREGDLVTLRTPNGAEQLEILKVDYLAID